MTVSNIPWSSRLVGARGREDVARSVCMVALEETKARAARLLLLRGRELETVAAINVAGAQGVGLRFETLALDEAWLEMLNLSGPSVQATRTVWPLRLRGRGFGLLEVLNPSHPELPPALPEGFLDMAALALEAARLGNERSSREREARSLADLSRQLGGTLELGAILERSVVFAVKAVGLERGLLALFDDVQASTAVSRRFFTHGFDARMQNEASVTISPASFERLVKKNQPIVLNDVKRSKRSYGAGAQALGAEAMLMVPISARGRPLGVLYLDSTKVGTTIRARQVSLVQALAEQASLAIENARLYAEESQKRSQAEALREIGLTLTSLDTGLILGRILEHARGLSNAAACGIFEDAEGTLELKLDLGLDDAVRPHLRFPPGTGAIGRAVREGRPVAVFDLEEDGTPNPVGLQRLIDARALPYRAMIAVPLLARERNLGGLALFFDAPRDFEESELQTLELFAAHAAVALENARNYEDEVRREREAETLLEISRYAGATLELDEVLSRVAQATTRALGLERCFIGFPENQQDTSTEIGPLYAYGFGDDLESYRPFIIAEDAYTRLFVEAKPIRLEQLSQAESMLGQGPRALAAEACLIAPLLVQNTVIGVLYADSTSRATISEHEVRLAAALASQAALAIENARLFGRLQTQEAHYRLLAESANDLILRTDLEGRIVYANDAASSVLGYTPEELRGLSEVHLYEPNTFLETQRVWREMLADFKRGEKRALSYQGEARRKDGSTIFLEVRPNLIVSQHGIEGGLSIARDLTSIKNATDEISRRAQEAKRQASRALELRGYLSLFTQAQEEERRRIARELHDDTAQTLVAITRRLDRLESMVGTHNPEALRERVRDVRGDVDAALDSVRRFSRNLRPSVLDDLGLMPALEWLVAQTRTPTRLELRGPNIFETGQRLDPELELTLFRVIQESLGNIDKHAHATSAAVGLEFDAASENWPARHGTPGLIVAVNDDGKGMRVGATHLHDGLNDEIFAHLAAGGHLGLAGIRERINLMGGELEVHSNEHGSGLRFWLPIEFLPVVR